MHSGAYGINASGQIVGFFRDAGLIVHGFLRVVDGSYTTLDVPGAIETVAQGVNDTGLIVGLYNSARSFLATPQ
jgi:probable HAF family extracellular repeat protein